MDKSTLFIFRKIYHNPLSLAKDINVPASIRSGEENLEADWYKYWLENGQELVNSSWLKLYSEYLNPDYSIGLENTIGNLSLSEETTVEESTESSDWQALWESHYSEVYSKYFLLYSENYYNAQNEFLLNYHDDKCSTIDDYTTIDDSKELISLGLPTSFQTARRKRKSKSYMENYSEESDEEYFSTSSTFEEMNETEDTEETDDDNEMKNIDEMDRIEDIDETDLDDNDYDQNSDSDHFVDAKSFPKNNTSILKIRKLRKLRKQRRLRKNKIRKLSTTMPQYLIEDNSLKKYWHKRYLLFSRYDEGIRMDKESWFSVTPEKIAISIADRMKNCDTVIDGFCGSGGNTIQLAIKCKRVIAIDIDPIKIEMCKHNAKIYNVDHKIEFIIGDFLQLSSQLKADAVFLSPPWGGPNYINTAVFDIEKSLLPIAASELIKLSKKITKNICMYLPRNSDKKEIIKTAGIGEQVEIIQNYLNDNVVALTVFYGNLIETKQ